jgi:hypothetical protein
VGWTTTDDRPASTLAGPGVAVGVGELDGVDCWDGPAVGDGDDVPTVGEGGTVPAGVGVGLVVG